MSFQYLGLGLQIFICLSHVKPCISTCLGCQSLKKNLSSNFNETTEFLCMEKKITMFSIVSIQMKISFLMQWMVLNDPILFNLSHQYSRRRCTGWSRFVSLERSEYIGFFDVILIFLKF